MAAPITPQKLFTLEEASAMLPLLRSILRDITELALDLRARHQKLIALQTSGEVAPQHQEEIDALIAEFDRDQDKLQDYVTELQPLGVELKDPYQGLIDFPAMMEGRVVYLCWKLDEPEIAHWHELDTGFAGRRKLVANLVN